MYDPEQLRTFLAVAQSLNFTAAGVSRGISQPTVSQQVRRLEEAVGRPLVVRDTRSVSLTADGEALAGFAKEILAAHDRAVGYFTGLHVSGRLRFGVTDDLALTPLPRILREFRRLHPQINLELTVLQNQSLVRRLESGYVDVAFVKRSADAPATNPGGARAQGPIGMGHGGGRASQAGPARAPGRVQHAQSQSGLSAYEPCRRLAGATASPAQCEASTGSSRPCEPGWASRFSPGHWYPPISSRCQRLPASPGCLTSTWCS